MSAGFDDLLDKEGNTLGDDLPTGSARSRGVAIASHSEHPDDYFVRAKIEHDVDFDNDPVTGRLYRYESKFAGFENAVAEVEVTGG